MPTNTQKRPAAYLICIDSHVTLVSSKIAMEASRMLVREGEHFDDSPFGSFTPLNIEEYFARKIIKRAGGVNKKFDILNYIKRSWQRSDNWIPGPDTRTVRERLAIKKGWAAFFTERATA